MRWWKDWRKGRKKGPESFINPLKQPKTTPKSCHNRYISLKLTIIWKRPVKGSFRGWEPSEVEIIQLKFRTLLLPPLTLNVHLSSSVVNYFQIHIGHNSFFNPKVQHLMEQLLSKSIRWEQVNSSQSGAVSCFFPYSYAGWMFQVFLLSINSSWSTLFTWVLTLSLSGVDAWIGMLNSLFWMISDTTVRAWNGS